MSHDPALEAHEHAEHAEHAVREHDPFISLVSITVAALAVMAATAGSLETVEGSRAITGSSAAVLAQDRATDAWNEYQADSLKRHLYEIAGEEGHDHKADINQQRQQQDAAKQTAQAAEGRDRERAASARPEERHHWLTGAATLVEIGIALSTVAIITKRRLFCRRHGPRRRWRGAVRGRICLRLRPPIVSRGFPPSPARIALGRAMLRRAAPGPKVTGPSASPAYA